LGIALHGRASTQRNRLEQQIEGHARDGNQHSGASAPAGGVLYLLLKGEGQFVWGALVAWCEGSACLQCKVSVGWRRGIALGPPTMCGSAKAAQLHY
jgi:hypothetical protein